jgi:hypothetical protein
MKIIITETQAQLISFLRRIESEEIIEQIEEIVVEGFDFSDPCNYETFESYLDDFLQSAAFTLINSYIFHNELSDEKLNQLMDYVMKKIKNRTSRRIKTHYELEKEYCDENISESIDNTRGKNFIVRRLQQFIDIVEDQIEGYELHEDNPWWCANSNPDYFFDNLRDRSIEEFVDKNWNFFHDTSEQGGSDTDTSMLYKIVEDNYGNYIRNLFVRKCRYLR